MSAQDLMWSCTHRLRYLWSVSKLLPPASRVSIKLNRPRGDTMTPSMEESVEASESPPPVSPLLVPGGRWIVGLEQHENSWVFCCWNTKLDSHRGELGSGVLANDVVVSEAIPHDLNVSLNRPVRSTIVACDYYEAYDTFNFIVDTRGIR
ncbi:hypothetical protein DL93DRAFT_2228234, partial [Clavulina sp. PMI_390]